MQPVELDALEALLAKASPGEWTSSSHDWFALRTHALIICDRPPVFYAESHAAWPDNSTAIAALHNAAPDLIAEARMLRVVRLALERALRERDGMIAGQSVLFDKLVATDAYIDGIEAERDEARLQRDEAIDALFQVSPRTHARTHARILTCGAMHTSQPPRAHGEGSGCRGRECNLRGCAAGEKRDRLAEGASRHATW